LVPTLILHPPRKAITKGRGREEKIVGIQMNTVQEVGLNYGFASNDINPRIMTSWRNGEDVMAKCYRQALHFIEGEGGVAQKHTRAHHPFTRLAAQPPFRPRAVRVWHEVTLPSCPTFPLTCAEYGALELWLPAAFREARAGRRHS
jgi:hypothetical protein